MKKYCKYCEEEKTIGECNKSLLESILKVNGQPFMGHQIFIERDRLVLFVDDGKYSNGYLYKYKRIKYCPMCGKELKD